MKILAIDYWRLVSRRGASHEAAAAVTSSDGEWLHIDTSHPAYPRKYASTPAASDPAKPSVAPAPEGGPGTELKGLLKWIGITSSPTCSCNARARTMDEWGPDVCEARLPEIVGWLEEQATQRRLPFVRIAAEQAVKLAIRRARKSAAH